MAHHTPSPQAVWLSDPAHGFSQTLRRLRAADAVPSGPGLRAYIVQHEAGCPFFAESLCTCTPTSTPDPYALAHLWCTQCRRGWMSGPVEGPLACPGCAHVPLAYCCAWEGTLPGCRAAGPMVSS